MNIQRTVRNVVSLPRRFLALGTASVHSLLQESGYFEVHAHVTEEIIHEALLEQPGLIDIWMEFSEAKRTSAGWFVIKEGPMRYQVGHFPDQEAVDYPDAAAACAAFIKREIEDIRKGG